MTTMSNTDVFGSQDTRVSCLDTAAQRYFPVADNEAVPLSPEFQTKLTQHFGVSNTLITCMQRCGYSTPRRVVNLFGGGVKGMTHAWG